MVTATYAPHPVQAGIFPGLMWVTQSLLHLAYPALGIAVVLPWFARNHDNTGILTYGVLILVAALVAWTVCARKLREHIRFHIPGAMRKGFAPPGALDLTVNFIEGAVTVTALYVAVTATDSMNEIGTFIVALTLGFMGAVSIPVCVRSAYRASRNHPQFEALRIVTSMCFHTGIPIAIALSAGWSLLPDRLMTGGREFIITALILSSTLLIVSVFINRATASRSQNDDHAGTPPRRTITINHIASKRDAIHELSDSIGDAVLSQADASPSLEDRERARGLARVGVYVALAAVLVLSLAMMIL